MTMRWRRWRSGPRVWRAFSRQMRSTFRRARSIPPCPAASPRSMRAIAKGTSPLRCSGTRTSQKHANCSFSPQAQLRNWKRSVRCSNALASGCLSSAKTPDWPNLVKLAANVLTATTLECMGEVLALMRKGGVDAHLAFDVLTNSLFDSRIHKSYGEKIVEGRYSPPGMTAPLAVKDLRLALAEAEREAVPMPAASLVHDRLVAMVARGWAELDWSALGLLAAVDAGLDDGR